MTAEIGTVASLWRYPVKSMIGEELTTAQVMEQGFLGDRAYALIDETEGNVATAKNPGKWPSLFRFHATLLHQPAGGTSLPPVRIVLPNGSAVVSTQPECNQILSQTLTRSVLLTAAHQGRLAGVQSSLPPSWTGQGEEYWPAIEGRDHRETVTTFTLPTGTFFDGATIHLVTTATLNRLQEAYPHGRFEVPRFRPNIVLETEGGEKGFVEQAWTGCIVSIGDVQLKITGSCGRCVMTTLAQGGLPKDSGILRTAVQENQGHVGVYASVVQSGCISRGDRVTLSSSK